MARFSALRGISVVSIDAIGQTVEGRPEHRNLGDDDLNHIL